MLRQRTTRSTPASPSNPRTRRKAKQQKSNSDLANETSSLLPISPPFLPTTISSLEDAFLPTLPRSNTESGESGSGSVSNLHDSTMNLSNLSRKGQWITLAVASGACAAFNGVFAKLTTTTLTTTIATNVAHILGLGNGEKVVEYVIRIMFFVLNLIFNGVMWALFTKALARGTSTTQVSIINTSTNFLITAILGFFIFTESLPPLWFAGAALLVAGNVIIGRREEKEVAGDEEEDVENVYVPIDQEEEGLSGQSLEFDESEEVYALRRKEEEDAEADILDLGEEDTPHPSQNARSSQ